MNQRRASVDEADAFRELQQQLAHQFRTIFPDDRAQRTVVVVPSLSLAPEIIAKISGVQHYEERMLCMLMLLRMPNTRVVYVTSETIDPWIVDYLLSFLSGVPGDHARRRLTLLACHDASRVTITEKILARPRLLQRIRDAIGDPAVAHMTCFHATAAERTLAVRLGIPLYACDPDLADEGSKSGSRAIFREAGVPMPAGFERLRDTGDIVEALTELKRKDPGLRKAAVKLEQGASGEGNAIFRYEDVPAGRDLHAWIRGELPARLRYVATDETWETFIAKYERMGGIVEAWIDGQEKCSPSVQCRIDPLGRVETISTHDQVLGGLSGQVFLGSTFPAREPYRLTIQRAGQQVAGVLKQRGVLGRFGVDFVTVKQGEQWRNYAIEINLRKGGTTHPFLMLHYLTDGHYEPTTGLFRTQQGRPCYYYASDNLENPHYRRLTPQDLIDIAVENDLHFHCATQQGVVFHLIGALSQYGKLGVLCVAASPEAAQQLYQDTVDILDREALQEP